jgi:DNA polymerase-3 subunit delta'
VDGPVTETLETPLQHSWPLGHEAVAKRLERQLKGEAMPHAQLFLGPRGVGKRLFARAFAKHLLDPQGQGGISDLIELAPEGRMGLHPLAQIEEVRRQAQMTALSGSWKVYLIDDVERMSPAAANSLLKILEEPPPRTLFLLVSGRPQALLPTIVSRCHVVLFEPLPDELLVRLLQERGVPPELVQIVAPRAHGSMERALRLAHQRQDPTALLLLEWLPRLHQLRTMEVTGRLAALDPDRSKQEADPQELRLNFEEQCQLLLDWARDAQLLQRGITTHLCFPEHQQIILQQHALGLASLRAMERAIYDAQLAVERMVKPSVLLTGLLLRLRMPDAEWA